MQISYQAFGQATIVHILGLVRIWDSEWFF